MKDEIEVNLLSSNAFAFYATLVLIGYSFYKLNANMRMQSDNKPTGTIGVRG